MSRPSIDVAIAGGGIAGCWALNLLRARGYSAILLEADQLGCDQTLASQGMIHGGLKYALSGRVTGASEAIADMPRRWRACLAGEDSVDLRGTRLLSDDYTMFAARSTLGRLTTFFASRTLRGRIDKLHESKWPAEFNGFSGLVYVLGDFVLDTSDLLATLVRGHEDRVLQLQAGGHCIRANPEGGYDIDLLDTQVHARTVVSCAGNGSQSLLNALSVNGIEVQQRPLKQVIVRPRHNTLMYGHCLTGVTTNEPRLTITSHQTADGVVWYLGGQLSTRGVDYSDNEQIKIAATELKACLPWLDWDGAEYETLTVNRAEPRQRRGLKPDQAYVTRVGDFVQCFPTKLTLAPDMGDRLLETLEPPAHSDELHTNHPRAQIGDSPW